jgi:hypothetical protein
VCWIEAASLREKHQIAKTNFPKAEWETFVFRNLRELQSVEELFILCPQKAERWRTNAFFAYRRIHCKHNSFPENFFCLKLVPIRSL